MADFYLSVELTGAVAGETIVGVHNITKKAVILILSGTISPHGKELNLMRLNKFRYQLFLQALSSIPRFSYLSLQERDEWLLLHQADSDDDVVDSDTVIKVIEFGDSDINYKISEENQQQLLTKSEWYPYEILEMFPRKAGSKARRHSLFFLLQFWKVQTIEIIKNFNGLMINSVTGKFLTKREFNLHNNNYKLVRFSKDICVNIDASKKRPSKQEVLTLVSSLTNTTLDDINEINKIFECFTPAGYKSLLQKIIRYQSLQISLLDETLYDSYLILLIMSTNLIFHPGSFVPDLNKFVGGLESFTKRLVVSICEDSYTDNFDLLLSLMSIAYVAPKITYNFTIEQVKEWFILEREVLKTNKIFVYDTDFIEPFENTNNNDTLYLLAIFLDKVKSFPSDLFMFRDIALQGGSYQDGYKSRPATMPIYHCIDHHVVPDIGYFYSYETVDKLNFDKLFNNIFGKVTGVNSRKRSLMFNSFLNETQNAQRLCFLSMQSNCKNKFLERIEMKETSDEKLIISLSFDRSWISGLLGSIEVKIGSVTCIVTLDVDNLYIRRIVRRPSRDVKETELTEQQKVQAENKFLEMIRVGLKLNKCTPPSRLLENCVIKLIEDRYYIIRNKIQNDLDDYQSVDFNISLLEPVKELKIENSFIYYGNGFVRDHEEQLKSLIDGLDNRIIQRLLNFISGNKPIIEMYKISRDGGNRGLSVLNIDVIVFEILCKLTLIYPKILSKGKLLSFRVQSIMLLNWLRDRIIEYIPEIKYDIEWNLQPDSRIPFKHQQEALNEMIDRNNMYKKGKVLWLNIGLGKTKIVFDYIYHLYENNQLPNYIIYTYPKSAYESILTEAKFYNFATAVINGNKTSKSKTFLKGHINFVEHDQLRKLVFDNIIEESIFIIDESHKVLAETKRTSNALELAKLSVDFISLTGTPVTDNKVYKLINWLELIQNFEVNENNFFSAAASAVQKHVDNVAKEEIIEILAELTPEENTAYVSLVSENLGGRNTDSSYHELREASIICYTAATRVMIAEIIKILKKETGIFVVAKDRNHQDQIKRLLLKYLGEDEIFLINKNQSICLTPASRETYRVVIAALNTSDAGYSLTKYKTMITSVYPSNLSKRRQIVGRINRVGQVSKTIKNIVVHCGILSYLLKYHHESQSLEIALRAMAKK